MANEVELLNSKLSTLNETTHTPALTTDTAGVYQIVGGDELVEKIDSVIAHLESVDLTEDDREMVRSTRKFTNDFIKAVDRSVIDERARVFDPVNEQRKSINERMTVMKSLLAQRLDEFDNRIRNEKREELSAHFDDERTMGEHSSILDNITFEMIENQSWTNRSSSLPKSKQELSHRVRALASVVSLADKEDETDALHLLTENDWNLPDVITVLENRKKAREEEREEEKRIARLIQEAEQRGRDQAKQETAVESVKSEHVDETSGVDLGTERELKETDLRIHVRGGEQTGANVYKIVNEALTNAVARGIIEPDCYTLTELTE